MIFDFTSDLPLFQQVAYQLELEIFHGTYQEGEQVPSTTEISTGYQINPATVLKGMNLLVDQGILEKRRGLGTYVAAGAMTIIQEKRQREFSEQAIPGLVQEAKGLNLTQQQLHEMITEEWEQ